jgi:hypothetical protein
MSIFKQAYARGVTESLLRRGHLKVASHEIAEKIADAVGERILFDPTAANLPPAHTAEVAAAILKEAEDTGSLVVGGDPTQANTPENAAGDDSTAAMDQETRPEGEYLEGAGETVMPEQAAQVGLEVPHPAAPGTTDPGANSVNKNASLSNILKKLADTGSLVTGGDPTQANTPENAAKDDSTAAMDQKERPEGAYVEGAGNTALSAAGAAVGKETPATPGTTDAGTNSAVEASKNAAYLQLFEFTAQKTAHALPITLSEPQKVAAVKQMMGMNSNEQSKYLGRIKAAEEKKDDDDKDEAKDKKEKKDKKKKDKDFPFLDLPMPLEAKEDDDEEDDEEKKASANGVSSLNVGNLLSEIANLANLASR